MTSRLQLLKMATRPETPVGYWLENPDQSHALKPLLGQSVRLAFTGLITCTHCGKKITKTFMDGLCFKCFQTLPQGDPGILRPELDQAHLGIARDMEWARANSLVDHYVYLAVASGLKVGVTRHTQVPTRWIDQGASMAIRLAKTPYRQLAGLIEVELKKHFNDKTNWQKMLKNISDGPVDLIEQKQRAWQFLPEELRLYVTDQDEITRLEYPVLEYPKKITSLKLDKQPVVEAPLVGIRGQYLIFKGGWVLNVRNHSGYWVELSY